MRVRIVCTETGGPMSFEVQDDTKTVQQNWKKTIEVECPHCGSRHSIRFKELYMQGVLIGIRGDAEGFRISHQAARR
jgi:DNA-directed RNA polymerase subunit RPC12/RpoP